MSESTLPHYVSINGRLVPPDAATVSVFNPAIYGAFGIYESMQMRDGVIFHFDDHLDRLITSARLISLPLAGDAATIAGWTAAMIEAHRQELPPGAAETATIRLFAVGASGLDELPQTFIWLQALSRPQPDDYVKGLGAVTFHGERAIPQSKSLNTLVNTLAKHKATAAGENEGLLVDRQGNVAEGGSSNLFVVQDGVLILPPDETILAGVTSQIVLMLAAEHGIPVARRPIPLAGMAQWDEAFLTSTSRHVLPLVRVDGVAVGAGVPGPVTQGLTRQFDAYFEAYIAARVKG
ncbi:MAG: aminotransferase class IV [Caldilineaceae bacterium]|nr:aminotransferase class IV [Caldilineaceae bacterium]MBP8110634.1 aminotransferase class IV [Caldilineaceae bacterium]MBP8124336.1 aminotransferase class IV [Caldilineaceae bacterium]MBP9071220.1 aminotransferase class IV [Caldilineaceae bacterium]